MLFELQETSFLWVATAWRINNAKTTTIWNIFMVGFVV
jgi:hypothetical protein